MKRGLRGHDGAVQSIAFIHAGRAHVQAGLIDLAIVDGRQWLRWTPPKPTFYDFIMRVVAVARLAVRENLHALTPQGL